MTKYTYEKPAMSRNANTDASRRRSKGFAYESTPVLPRLSENGSFFCDFEKMYFLRRPMFLFFLENPEFRAPRPRIFAPLLHGWRDWLFGDAHSPFPVLFG